MKKLKLSKYLSNISFYEFEGDIIDASKVLSSCYKFWAEKSYSNIRLSLVTDGFDIFGERLETDEEYEKRLATSAKSKIARQKSKNKKELAERELYEKLKAKYENNSIQK